MENDGLLAGSISQHHVIIEYLHSDNNYYLTIDGKSGQGYGESTTEIRYTPVNIMVILDSHLKFIYASLTHHCCMPNFLASSISLHPGAGTVVMMV